jgi:DNA-binding response OmpR family regulator
MSANPTTPSSSRRILLVEDHADTANAMSRLLERLGHQIHIADCLGSARKLAGEHVIDLLICDIRLPDGSGLDLLQEMRAQRPALRGIALSGLDADDHRAQSSRAGFERHLCKPVDFATLRKTVDEMVR